MNLEDFEVDVHGKHDVIPERVEEGSVGYDVPLPEEEAPLVLGHNCRRVIDTGIVVRPPEKCFEMIVPRSSTYNMNVRISNTIGVIDPSYSGRDDTIMVSMERGPSQLEFYGEYKYMEGGYSSPYQFVMNSVKWEDDFPFTENLDLDDVSWYEPEEGLIHVFTRQKDDPVVYEAGERFCQIVFLPFSKPDLIEKRLEEFDKESRGGYGSTGK
jgi:dUTPase